MPDELLNAGSQPQAADTTITTDSPGIDTPAPGADAADTSTEPKSMLEAINRGLDAEPAKAGTEVVDPNDPTKAKPVVDPAKPAPAAAAKPDDKAKPKDDKGKDDLYKMPVGLKAESQQRFQKLVDTTKDAVARAERAEGAAQQNEQTISSFRQILDDTRTSSEDLSQLLEYNRLVKSGDLESALAILDQQRQVIAQHLGKPVEGVDVLDGYEDLKKDVQEQTLTLARAAEIARSRRVDAALRQQGQNTAQQQQAQQQRQQVTQKALGDIAAFASDRAANDIDYKHKEKILLDAVTEISNNFPPHLWLAQVQLLYKTITAPPAAPALIPGQRPPQPLRPGSPGGGKPQPATMFEALDQGLGYAQG